jgi:hypothetical protein
MLKIAQIFIFIVVFTSTRSFASITTVFSNNYLPKKVKSAATLPAKEDFRFGGGVGFGLFVTNQMDYHVTTNFGDYRELLPTYFAGVYKKVNPNLEIGMQGRFGSLFTLKSDNTQGSRCDFNELQVSAVYSFTKDVSMEWEKFTVNGIVGFGVTNFRAKYFTVNPRTQREELVVASVGYGNKDAKGFQAERQTAFIGHAGLAIGYQLNNLVSLYGEATYNMCASNKLSGHLLKTNFYPQDGYFYTSVGVFIRFGDRRGQLGCPKF